MYPALRTVLLLLLFCLTLTACAASASQATMPAATPMSAQREQAVEAAPANQVELASGRYQLLMFYSPL